MAFCNSVSSFLLLAVAIMLAANSRSSMAEDVARIINALAQSLIDEEHANRCVMVYIKSAKSTRMPVGENLGQAVVVKTNATHADLPNLSMMLKNQAWCTVATAENGNDLRTAIQLVRPVERKMVVSLGPTEEETIVNEILLVNTRVVWLEETPRKQVHLSVKCPIVTPTPWHIEKNINLWRGREGGFLITDPGVINCKNPMFGQNLQMLHFGERSQVIYSPETGLPVGGKMFKILKILSDVYHFYFSAIFAPLAVYHAHNNSHTGGPVSMVYAGTGFTVFGPHVIQMKKIYDLPAPYSEDYNIFLSRRPIPIDTYDNLVNPLSPGVWAGFMAASLSFGILMLISYSLYWSNIEMQHLVKKESALFNIILWPAVKITEPDALPWFPCWSTGRVLVFKWTVLSAFMVMFYTSNLRAHLIHRELEKPIDTLQDVVDNGQTPYVYRNMHIFTKSYLELTGQTESPLYGITDLAERTGGFYDPADALTGDLFDRIGKDMIEERATYLTTRNSVSLLYLNNKKYFGRQGLYLGKESFFRFYETVALRKYSPATPFVSKVIRRIMEAGLADKYLNDFVTMEQSREMKETFKEATALKIRTYYLAMMFFAFGIFSASLAAITEICSEKRSTKVRHV